MSYGTKYYSYIKGAGTKDYTVNLKYADYTGSSTQVRYYSTTPLVLSYGGGREMMDTTVHGSTMSFSFYADTTDNYDDLLEAENYYWQIEVLEGTTGATSLKWIGFIKPENISKRFIQEGSYISLYATDALADLKEQKYPFSLRLTTGSTSILKALKIGLEQADLELPIKSQLNTTEVHLSGATLLDNILINPYRFVKIEDGRVNFVKTYDAVSWMLNPFNVKMNQENGAWKITQRNEIESPLVTYNWQSLTGTSATVDRSIDISTSHIVRESDSLSRIAPYKSIETKYRNITAGDWVPQSSLNGTFNVGVTGWNSADGAFAFDFGPVQDTGSTANNFNNRMLCVSDERESYVYGPPFILNNSQGSQITVYVDVELRDVVFTGSPSNPVYPKFKCELVKDWIPVLGETESDGVVVDTITKTLPYEVNKSFIFQLNFTAPIERHYLRFYLDPQTAIHSSKIYFDNVQVFRNYDDSTAFDRMLVTENTDTTAIQIEEKTLYFGDSEGDLDSGALYYAPSANTTSWSSYDAGINQFGNHTFDGPGLSPWVEYTDPSFGGGLPASYLGGLSNDVQYSSSVTTYSKLLSQGEFSPGNYTVQIQGYNHNDISGGVTNNGVIRLRKRVDNVWTVISANTVPYHASNLYSVSYSFTLDDYADIAVQLARTGPGSDFDMSIGSCQVTSFEGFNSNIPLVNLHNYQRLVQAQRSRHYAAFTIFDEDNEISFSNALTIAGRTFNQIGHTYDFKNGFLQLELVEYLNSPITVFTDEIDLTTVDGNPLNEDD
jgi:hypothetical protein